MEDHRDQTATLIEKVDRLHSSLSTDINQLKMSQSKCDSKWSVSEKVVGWGFGSSSLLALITWIFSNHTSGK